MNKASREVLVLATLLTGMVLSSISHAHSLDELSLNGKRNLAGMTEKVREKGLLEGAMMASLPLLKLFSLGSTGAVAESASGVLGADDWQVWSHLVGSRGVDKSLCKILRDRYYGDMKLNRSKYNQSDRYHITKFYKSTCK